MERNEAITTVTVAGSTAWAAPVSTAMSHSADSHNCSMGVIGFDAACAAVPTGTGRR